MVLRLIRTGFLNSVSDLPVSRTCQIFANLLREFTLYLRRSLFVNSQHIRSCSALCISLCSHVLQK